MKTLSFFLVILYLILKIQELFRKICKYFEIRIYGGSECLMNYVHEVQSYQLILFQEHKINLPFIFFNCQHFISVFVTRVGCLSFVLFEFDIFAQGDEETELIARNP